MLPAGRNQLTLTISLTLTYKAVLPAGLDQLTLTISLTLTYKVVLPAGLDQLLTHRRGDRHRLLCSGLRTILITAGKVFLRVSLGLCSALASRGSCDCGL